RLGCGAALEQLRRLRSEPFGLERAVTLDELAALDADAVWARAGRSLEQALAHLPSLKLTVGEAIEIGYGGRPSLPAQRGAGLPIDAGRRSLVILSHDGRVLALGAVAAQGEVLEVRAHVVFPWAAREGRVE